MNLLRGEEKQRAKPQREEESAKTFSPINVRKLLTSSTSHPRVSSASILCRMAADCLVHTMTTRQRLKAFLDVRRASQPCRRRDRSHPLIAIRKPHLWVKIDGRPMPLGTRAQSPSVQASQKTTLLRISAAGPVDFDTRVQSQSMETVRNPRISRESDERPTALSIRKYTSLLPKHLVGNGTRRARLGRSIIHKIKVEGNYIRYKPDGPDATNRLVPIAGPLLGESPTLKVQCKQEAFLDAVTLALNSFTDLSKARMPAPISNIGGSISGTRFSPQERFSRRAPLGISRTSTPHSLDVSKKAFSTRTPRGPNRHYATATASERRLLSFLSCTKTYHRTGLYNLMPQPTRPLLE